MRPKQSTFVYISEKDFRRLKVKFITSNFVLRNSRNSGILKRSWSVVFKKHELFSRGRGFGVRDMHASVKRLFLLCFRYFSLFVWFHSSIMRWRSWRMYSRRDSSTGFSSLNRLQVWCGSFFICSRFWLLFNYHYGDDLPLLFLFLGIVLLVTSLVCLAILLLNFLAFVWQWFLADDPDGAPVDDPVGVPV